MKQIFTLSIFLLAALVGFTQGKGKEKTKGKQKTEVKSTVPAPTGQSTKPEVKTKEKPQIYQKADTTKTTTQGVKTTNSSASGESSTTTSTSTSSSESTTSQQTSTSGGESTTGQTSTQGGQTQSGQNSQSTSQTGTESNTQSGSVNKQGESTMGSEAESGKGKDKMKGEKNKNGNGNSKTRINIPTQVRNSFNRDYPNAVNTVWTKNRGDWTVTFGNNAWNSTATYHSNGERVDTRTPIRRDETPRPVQDEILKRFPQTNPKDIIKIEKPQNPNLFQVVVEQAGKIKTMIFDEKGKLVSQMQDVIK